MRIISMRALAEPLTILSGASRGMAILAKVNAEVLPEQEPTVLILDFQGIELATSSFLRTAVLGFRDQCVALKLNVFPAVANLSAESLEELRLALPPYGDAVFVCETVPEGQILSWQIIGTLDEKQMRTLEAIAAEGEADAGVLMELHRDTENIGSTGWNNRLAALARKALVIELKRGKTKRYRPVKELLQWA